MEHMNVEKERVVAITVTYNRTRTLERCLQALKEQTRPVDVILIVDNNSKQEEKEKIAQMIANEDKIYFLPLKENLGGAGGFEAGMKMALEEWNPDWYWIMDDDAYPRKDCLERLMNQAKELSNVGGLCPAIYGIDLNEYQMYHHKKMSKVMMKNIPVAKRYEDLEALTLEDANAFVGPLFPKKVVQELGIADGSLFIYGDDSEYTYRISRKYPLYLVKNAIIDHQDAPVTDSNMKPEGWWKEYYCNRNQYFMIREFKRNSFLRLVAYIILTLRLLAIVVKSKIKGYHSLRSLLIFKAIKDGMQNKRGKVLDPQKYIAFLKEQGIK